MKKFLLAVCLFPLCALAAITDGGSEDTNDTPAITSLTHICTVSADTGDLITVAIADRDESSAPISVLGSVNGAYTQAGSTQQTNSSMASSIFYFQNSGSGSETITVTWGATVRADVNCHTWSGAATSSALDQNNGASQSSATTSHSHGSITTTSAGLIIVSLAAGGDAAGTYGDSFIAMANGAAAGFNRSSFGYRIVTGSTTTTGPFTSSGSIVSAGKIASFNEAGGASGLLLRRRRN